MKDSAEKVLQMINEHTDKIKVALSDESKTSSRRNQEMTFSMGFLYGLIAVLDEDDLLSIPENERSSLRDEAVRSAQIIGEWAAAYRQLQASESLSDNAMPSQASKLN